MVRRPKKRQRNGASGKKSSQDYNWTRDRAVRKEDHQSIQEGLHEARERDDHQHHQHLEKISTKKISFAYIWKLVKN